MRNKLKYNFRVFALFLTAIFGIGVSYAECRQDINEGIQKIIEENRTKYQIPGIEVSVSFPNEDLPRDFVSGTTTIGGHTPVQPNHLFQIGSETKSFIAAVILQLEAEGWLSIYDPIGKYLKNIPDAWQGISIQQLLNHTSGIFNYTDHTALWEAMKDGDFKNQWSSDELIGFAKDKELNFRPGSGWSYSNTNYVLAGQLVEAVTGKTIEEELNARLLQPLHLSNTHYYSKALSSEVLQQMAHGFSEFGAFPDEPKDITDQNMSWANTAGALVSTSHDTAIWLRHLLTDNKLLANMQRQELLKLVDTESGQFLPAESNKMGYGLGVEKFNSQPNEIWGHSGGTLGFISQMYWLKCNDVVLTVIVNHVDKNEMEGRGSSTLAMELINFIQQSDLSKNSCQVGLMPGLQPLSSPLKLISKVDKLVPKHFQ